MMKIIAILSLCSVIIFQHSFASSSLNITLNSNAPNEQTAMKLLEELFVKYDLGRYSYTKRIFIKSFSVPHSHPVLTLNTKHIQNPDRFLSTYLHEQIHWFFSLEHNQKSVENFIKFMREQYPVVPDEQNGGAQNIRSTYLHFGVCFYELELLAELIGHDKAIDVFRNNDDIYFWIIDQVLQNNDLIKNVLIKAGLPWQNVE